MERMIKWVCCNCGGDRLVSDASAIWDNERQRWVLSDVLQDTFCEDCEDSVRIEEEELNLGQVYGILTPDEDQ